MKENMNRETEFINKMYKNASMGAEAISYLVEKVGDCKMLSDLQAQHQQYNDIMSKCLNELSNQNQTPKSKNPMTQFCVWSGVQMNTLIDKSNDHIAEMMIQGSMMGIIDITRTLKEYNEIPENLKRIGEELVTLEENNVQRMKEYLG